jgi:hypothetical protein
MAILVRCECGQKLRASDDHAGKSFPCPACGKTVAVPAQEFDDRDEIGPIPDFQDAAVSPSKASPTGPLESRRPRTAIWQLAGTGVAVLLSIIALCIAIFRHPLGRGMNAYDFSTPSAALKSQIEMALNNDIRAAIELETMRSRKAAKEKLNTLKIHKESEYGGKKILFISFEKNGILKYDIESFEKDADSGLWYHSYVGTYDMKDSDLKKAIEDWQKKAGKVQASD